MTASLVVQEIDPNSRVATAKWDVAPLPVTTAWVTAANALITATFGAGLLSLAGVDEAYYEHDLVTAQVNGQPNADVRRHWQLANQSGSHPADRQQIGAAALGVNLETGTFILADLTSSAWVAYLAAVGAANFGWVDNNGNASPTVLGAYFTVRGRKAKRISVGRTPNIQYGAHLVVKAVDDQGRHGELRIRVTPLTFGSTWFTAANALLAATYGAGAISTAGYRRAFLKQDILTGAIVAQSNTAVQEKWTVTSKGSTGSSFKFQIPVPNRVANIASGTEDIAAKGSSNWQAFITALGAANLGWIGNQGQASPVFIGAKLNARARKAPRQEIRG